MTATVLPTQRRSRRRWQRECQLRLPSEAAHRAHGTPRTRRAHAPHGGRALGSRPTPNHAGEQEEGSARTRPHTPTPTQTHTASRPRGPALGHTDLSRWPGPPAARWPSWRSAAQRGRRRAGTAAAPCGGGRSPRAAPPGAPEEPPQPRHRRRREFHRRRTGAQGTGVTTGQV